MNEPANQTELRLAEVARVSLKRTREGVLDWRTTDDEAAFLFSGTSSSIIADFYPRKDLYEIRILNSRGTIVESLRSREVTVDEGPWSSVEPAPWNELLKELHDAARRSALRIDEVLDETLQELNNLGLF